MARYYLHLRDHVDEVLDPEGQELADQAALEKAALTGARDVIAGDVARTGVIDLRYRIDIEDAGGTIVHSLAFGDAVRVIPPGSDGDGDAVVGASAAATA